ncbi:hypothetical protein [Streptomyces sp. NPDC001389]|uniref:hypothetical protein n=1 Tax=Streptomyces sp. NPDC001389 TaxID=3364569 RepID=UPI0036A8210B
MPLAAPNPASVVPGSYITGALWNANVYNGLTFLTNRPVFVGQQQVVQSVANTAWAVLTFDTEIVDSYGGHSTVSNTSRYTCQLAGWYRVGGRAAFAVNSAGSRGARIHLNGSYIQGAANLCGAGNLTGIVEVSHLMYLNVGDYIEVAGGQNCGAALSTVFANEGASMMYAIWEHA